MILSWPNLAFVFILGDNPIVGISSDIAHYYLLDPHPLYAPVSWSREFYINFSVLDLILNHFLLADETINRKSLSFKNCD